MARIAERPRAVCVPNLRPAFPTAPKFKSQKQTAAAAPRTMIANTSLADFLQLLAKTATRETDFFSRVRIFDRRKDQDEI
jgi:hypothetical protein